MDNEPIDPLLWKQAGDIAHDVIAAFSWTKAKDGGERECTAIVYEAFRRVQGAMTRQDSN